MKKIGYILLLSLLTFSLSAQNESGDVRDGNKLYKSGKFTEAEIAYRKGLQKNPKSVEATYNLGNTLYKQNKYPEALEQYSNALALQPQNKKQIAAALHNAGNALFADKKYEESLKAYQMALKANPKDEDTRYNLALTQKMLIQDDKEDKVFEQAQKLVAQRKYKEAYALMKAGEQRNKALLKHADFTNRILNVIKML